MMSLDRKHRILAACLGVLAAATCPGKGHCAEQRTTSLEGEAAEVEVFEHFEPDTFRLGVKLYTNRTYTLKEAPDYLIGQPFARSAIDRTGFRCTKEGLVTLLTPDPAHPRACSLYEPLEAAGFVRIIEPKVFQLFGEAEYDLVRVYRPPLSEE